MYSASRLRLAGIALLDTKTHALLDVFVMNFKTHVVFDYAPGSLHPESSGTIKIVKTGKTASRSHSRTVEG